MTATDPNEQLLGVIPRINRLAFKAAARSGADPDDLFQSFALAVLRAAPRYDPARGAFTSYVAVVCKRQLGKLADRQARQIRAGGFPVGADGSELLPADPRAADPAAALVDAEADLLRRRRLYSAFARLTELERSAVKSRFGLCGKAEARTAADFDPTRNRRANQATFERAMLKLELVLSKPLNLRRRLNRQRVQRERKAALSG